MNTEDKNEIIHNQNLQKEENFVEQQNKTLSEVSVIDSNERDYEYKEGDSMNTEDKNEIIHNQNLQKEENFVEQQNKTLSEVSVIDSNEQDYEYKEGDSINKNKEDFKNKNSNLIDVQQEYYNESEDDNIELSHESIDYGFNPKRLQPKKITENKKKPEEDLLRKNSSDRKRIEIEFSENNENNFYHNVADTENQTVTELELSPSKNLILEQENFKIDQKDNLNNNVEKLNILFNKNPEIKNPKKIDIPERNLMRSNNSEIKISQEILNFKEDPSQIKNDVIQNFKNKPLLNIEKKIIKEKNYDLNENKKIEDERKIVELNKINICNKELNNLENINNEFREKNEINFNNDFNQKKLLIVHNKNLNQNLDRENDKSNMVSKNLENPEKKSNTIDMNTINAYNKVKWDSNAMVLNFVNRNLNKNVQEENLNNNNPVLINNLNNDQVLENNMNNNNLLVENNLNNNQITQKIVTTYNQVKTTEDNLANNFINKNVTQNVKVKNSPKNIVNNNQTRNIVTNHQTRNMIKNNETKKIITNNKAKNIDTNNEVKNIFTNDEVRNIVTNNEVRNIVIDNQTRNIVINNQQPIVNQKNINNYNQVKTHSNENLNKNSKPVIDQKTINEYNRVKYSSNKMVHNFINKNLSNTEEKKNNEILNKNEIDDKIIIGESIIIKKEEKPVFLKKSIKKDLETFLDNKKNLLTKINKNYGTMEKISEEEEVNLKNDKNDYKIERTASDQERLNILCSEIPIIKQDTKNVPKKKYYSDRLFKRDDNTLRKNSKNFDIKNVETINEEKSIISKNYTTIPKSGIINPKFDNLKKQKNLNCNISTYSYRENYKARNSSPLKIHKKGLTFRIKSNSKKQDHFFSNNSKIKSRVSQTMDRRLMQSRFKNKPEPRYSNISDSDSHIDKDKNIYLFRNSNNSILKRSSNNSLIINNSVIKRRNNTEDSVNLNKTPTIIYKKQNEYNLKKEEKEDFNKRNSRSSKIIVKSNNPFSSKKEIGDNIVRKGSYYSKREIVNNNNNINRNYEIKKKYSTKDETNIYYKKKEEILDKNKNVVLYKKYQNDKKEEILDKNKNVVLYKNYQNDKKEGLNRYGYKVTKTKGHSTRFILSNEKKNNFKHKIISNQKISDLNFGLVKKNNFINSTGKNEVLKSNQFLPKTLSLKKEEKKIVRIKI